MLRETVEIVKSMWTEPETTYKGEYYELSRANCDPKPLQDPHPPVWIGGGGEQLTLRVVARHADCSNFGGSPEQWAHKRDVLRGHCADVGRDPDAIRMTWSPEVFIRSTEAEVDAAGSRSLWGEPVETLAGGQPRRHPGAGRREDPDLRRPRLPRRSSRGAPTTPTPRPSSSSPPRSSPTSGDVHPSVDVPGSVRTTHSDGGEHSDGTHA